MEEKAKGWNGCVKYKNLTNNLSTAMIFYAFSILLEFFSGLLVVGMFPSYFFFGLATIHLISFLIFLLPGKWTRYIVAIAFFVVHVVITVTNDILYHSTGEIFTFDKLALAGGGLSVLNVSLINFGHMIVYATLLVLFLTCLFVVPKHSKKFKATRKQFFAILSIWFFGLFSFLLGLGLNFNKNRALWISQFPSTLAYQSYGYYGFYAPNGINFIKSTITNQALDDQSFQEAQEFVLAGKETKTNSMTGVSEGNNLIMILAESVDIAGIDPVFTPFLYQLYFHDGMYLKNYHTENKTNMSEGMALYGNYGDKHNLVNTIKTAEAVNYFSLPTLFKQKAEQEGKQATANYFHGLMANFYSRDLTFKMAGFDELYFADIQENEIKEYNKQNNNSYDFHSSSWVFVRDSNFIEFNMEKFIPSEGRFMSAYATITTHGSYEMRDCIKPYYEILTSDNQKLENLFDYMESQGFVPRELKQKANLEKFLYYKSAMMDLDKTLSLIFERLKETNNLENTTVVFYPDHNAYFDDISYNLRGIYGADTNKCNVSAYNLGAVIYDQKMIAKYKGEKSYTSGVVVDDFVSVWDIYPTICNALNLSYNKNLAYGKDLFSDDYHIFMTLKDSKYIFNNKFYYYDKAYALTEDYDKAEMEKFEQAVKELLKSEKIHENLYGDINSFKKILEM